MKALARAGMLIFGLGIFAGLGMTCWDAGMGLGVSIASLVAYLVIRLLAGRASN